jgi:hypothetical protein
MAINLDQEPSVERRSVPNPMRSLLLFFLFLGFAPMFIPMMCNSLRQEAPPPPVERSKSFSRKSPASIGEALAGIELPRLTYTQVTIQDAPGTPVDPVHVPEGLLGVVYDSAKPLLVNGRTGGYLVGGTLYDAGGHPFGTVRAGPDGSELRSLDEKLIGWRGQQGGKDVLLNPDRSLAAVLGERQAVVADLERYRLKAVIDGYDFNRPNK